MIDDDAVAVPVGPIHGRREPRERLARQETTGSAGRGERVQVLRAVVDVVQQCNLRCLYCHPGDVWQRAELPVPALDELLVACERYGMLEVVLSGGEMTLHPQLEAVLEATHRLDRTASTIVTNGTRLTPRVLSALAASNVSRICTSLDSDEEGLHATARGDNLGKVLRGLEALVTAGKPVTVISVAHKQNFHAIGRLTRFLADSGLATQHHIVAPSYSGEARQNYPQLRLDWDDYFMVQAQVDELRAELADRDFIVTFNSFWPATGHRSAVDARRTVTLQQLTEQSKDTYVIVRPNGDFRLTMAAWGRETVGDHVLGRLGDTAADQLVSMAHEAYVTKATMQMPRAVEARHKFHIGEHTDGALTDQLITTDEPDVATLELMPLRPLVRSDILDCELLPSDLAWIEAERCAAPSNLRVVEHATGALLVVDKVRSRVTVFRSEESELVESILPDLVGAGT